MLHGILSKESVTAVPGFWTQLTIESFSKPVQHHIHLNLWPMLLSVIVLITFSFNLILLLPWARCLFIIVQPLFALPKLVSISIKRSQLIGQSRCLLPGQGRRGTASTAANSRNNSWPKYPVWRVRAVQQHLYSCVVVRKSPKVLCRLLPIRTSQKQPAPY